MAANMCAAFLNAARKVAKEQRRETDRACAVFDYGAGHYEVRRYNDSIMWSGKAHCRYCARAEAILHSDNATSEV